MQSSHLPEKLKVETTATISGVYTCKYRVEFEASLSLDKVSYASAPGQYIEAVPYDNGGWKKCFKGYLRHLKVPSSSIDSDKKNHRLEAEVNVPVFGDFQGGLDIVTDKAPRLGESVRFRTSLFKLAVEGTTQATPIDQPGKTPSFQVQKNLGNK